MSTYPDLCNPRATTYQSYVTGASEQFPPNFCIPRETAKSLPRELLLPECEIFRHTYKTTTKEAFPFKALDNFSQASEQHTRPAKLETIDFVKSEFAAKVATKNFNPNPVHDVTITQSSYPAKHCYPSVYGDPVYPDQVRNVYRHHRRKHVTTFDRDVPSVIRSAHPFLSTYNYHHRRFTPTELRMVEETCLADLQGIKDLKNKENEDVAIKLRVVPMEGPFESRERRRGKHMNFDYDSYKACPLPGNHAYMRHFFDVPLYQGCPPRTFPPVPTLGMNPTTKDHFSWPYRIGNRDNHSTGVNFSFASKIKSTPCPPPDMYTTISKIIGSEKPVSTFLPIHARGTWRHLANATTRICPPCTDGFCCC